MGFSCDIATLRGAIIERWNLIASVFISVACFFGISSHVCVSKRAVTANMIQLTPLVLDSILAHTHSGRGFSAWCTLRSVAARKILHVCVPLVSE